MMNKIKEMNKLVLESPENTIKLRVLGYEYPSSRCYYDGNWLMIEIEANTQDVCWVKKSSSLTAFEMVKLYNWFVGLRPMSGEQRIEFIEGDIYFSFNRDEERLSVFLDYGLHPNADRYNYEKDSEIEISFRANADNLQKCVSFFLNCTKHFPIKNLSCPH